MAALRKGQLKEIKTLGVAAIEREACEIFFLFLRFSKFTRCHVLFYNTE